MLTKLNCPININQGGKLIVLMKNVSLLPNITAAYDPIYTSTVLSPGYKSFMLSWLILDDIL